MYRTTTLALLITTCATTALTACATDEADTFEPDEIANTEDASGKADGTFWLKVYTCNNGAAVLDVNANERRDLQFVIRDQRAIGWLASQVRVSTQGIISPSGEIIIPGRQSNGVFSKSDFRSLDGGVPYVSVNVRREGNGIKAVFYQQIGWSRCADGGEPSPSTGTCNGDTVSGSTYNELANWYFDSCY
jgi:hypothetical protein